jgi:hypothetical protein
VSKHRRRSRQEEGTGRREHVHDDSN